VVVCTCAKHTQKEHESKKGITDFWLGKKVKNLSLLLQVSCALEGVHVRVVAGPYTWAARSITLLTCYSSRVIYVYLGEFCYAQPFLRAPFKGIFMFEPALSNHTPPHNKPKSITASFSFGFFSPNLRNLLLFVLFFFSSFFLPRILFFFRFYYSTRCLFLRVEDRWTAARYASSASCLALRCAVTEGVSMTCRLFHRKFA
jgi:hypothetical protein